MSRRFEKSLSLILIILIMVEFVITGYVNIAGGDINPIFSEIWSICFILSWILMLVYSLYILFQNSSRGFSIFTAIISTLSFMALTYHGIIISSTYFDFLPKGLSVSNRFLIANGQIVFYTAIFVCYLIHLINLLKINKDKDKNIEEKSTLDVEEKTSDQVFLIDNDNN
ncbi:MAG: hypothetical protein PUG67_07595 [Peptoniphilaceae bacterium]|nr:hypothetical protein [Peptoniphilaceae bacterium]MDY6018239.1 hypothetical protein [Anaerococcus sp.]